MHGYYTDPATGEKLPTTGPTEVDGVDQKLIDVTFLPEVDEDGRLIVPEGNDPATGGLAKVIPLRPRS